MSFGGNFLAEVGNGRPDSLFGDRATAGGGKSKLVPQGWDSFSSVGTDEGIKCYNNDSLTLPVAIVSPQIGISGSELNGDSQYYWDPNDDMELIPSPLTGNEMLSGALSNGNDLFDFSGFDEGFFGLEPEANDNSVVYPNYSGGSTPRPVIRAAQVKAPLPNSGSEKTTSRRSRFHCLVVGCQRSYTRVHELRRHQKAHSGEKPFACTQSLCDRRGAKGFVRKDHLRQHTRRVHGISV